MTTITIEITDEQAESLAQEAVLLNMTVEEFAVQRLLQAGDRPSLSEEELDKEIDFIFTKNAELYRRLA